MRLRNKVAVVTGAGSGIGQGIALRFAEEGAKVVVDDIMAERAHETVARIKAEGGDAVAVKADVTKRTEVRRMLQTALDRYGWYDILVNNAGRISYAPFLELSEEDWDNVMALNNRAVYLCTQEAAREWVGRSRPGRVVNIGSVAGEMAREGMAHYSASKAAVRMFTRAVALELAPHKITVNCVAPGAVPGTRIGGGSGQVSPEALAMFSRSQPMGRVATPRDIANAALFYASDDAGYVSGQITYVDGAWGTRLSPVDYVPAAPTQR